MAEEDDHLGQHVLVDSLHDGQLPVETCLHFLGVDDPLADGLLEMAFFAEEFPPIVSSIPSTFSCSWRAFLVTTISSALFLRRK